MNFSLRPARSLDAEGITHVLIRARQQALAYLPQLYSDDQILQWIKSGVMENETVWVADAGGQVIGFLSFVGDKLNHLYVEPSYQRKGVGQALLEIAKANSPHLLLFTFERNQTARSFYEKHGFNAIRFGDGSHNEEHEPDVLMEWRKPSTDFLRQG
jgi:ribosomal protein S18 acetylase RimI-like enzyme